MKRKSWNEKRAAPRSRADQGFGWLRDMRHQLSPYWSAHFGVEPETRDRVLIVEGLREKKRPKLLEHLGLS